MNELMAMDKACIRCAIPTAPRLRVSQRPGFIPLKTGDPIPDELRAQLNVDVLIRELRKAALEIIESELEP